MRFRLFQRVVMPLLLLAAAVCPAPRAAADPVSCSVSSLKQLMALDGKAFAVRKERFEGHSTEGGTLTILSRKGIAQRARAEMLGEAGKLVIDLAHIGGDVMAIARWTYYAEPLPKTPARVSRIEAVTGFFCAGALIVDRQEAHESVNVDKGKIAEFQELIIWLLGELKARGVYWS